MNGGNPWLGFLPLILVGLIVIPMLIAWIRIFSRVGWPPWLGVFILVPLVNFVLVLVFAFKEWPIERRVRHLNEPHGSA